MITIEELSSLKREIAEAIGKNITPGSIMQIIDRYLEQHVRLYDLHSRTLKCTQCELRAGCKQIVLSEGTHRTELMFIGEGPGEVEDKVGKPFAGPAGQLLDRMLTAANWNRREIYIANIVKCRPPENRDPNPQEINACLPWLHQEIDIINPKIIVCLGSVAAKVLIDPNFKITEDHGKWFKVDGRDCTAVYHPAFILRRGEDTKLKAAVWKVLQDVQNKLCKG